MEIELVKKIKIKLHGSQHVLTSPNHKQQEAFSNNGPILCELYTIKWHKFLSE